MKKPAIILFILISNQLFAQNPSDNIISRKTVDALPNEYPNGVYLMDSETDAPYSWPEDAGTILGLKPYQSNSRHTQLLIDRYGEDLLVRGKDWSNDSWTGWKRVLTEKGGKVGVGISAPEATIHLSSACVDYSTTDKYSANMLVEGTSTTRDPSEGASIGFIIPANTDGSNPWQQGRILVTPDNANNGRADGRMYLQTRYYSGSWQWRDNLVLKPDGHIGVGTDDPTEKFEVNGTIRSKEVKVESTGWPDYVFKEEYILPSLRDTENYIRQNQHLPGIPSAQEVKEKGVSLGEMNAKLLEKIEELTLYQIDMMKTIELLQERLKTLEEHTN